MNHKVLKLMFLLAVVSVLTRCADDVDDSRVGTGWGSTPQEDDSHGWGSNVQNAGKK
jgi:hypothetical protein